MLFKLNTVFKKRNIRVPFFYAIFLKMSDFQPLFALHKIAFG